MHGTRDTARARKTHTAMDSAQILPRRTVWLLAGLGVAHGRHSKTAQGSQHMPSKSPPCVVRASSACPPLAQIARHAAGPTRPGLAAREAGSTRRRTTKQRIRGQHVPSRSSPVPVGAASACTLPARLARHAADTTRPGLAAREASNRHRRMIEQHAQYGHQAPGREDDARRRREERVSTVLDHARERGPTDGEPDDVLTISVDAAAFDGRPTASASSRSTRSTTTVARGTPGLSGTHRGREGRVGHAGGAQQRRTRARVSTRVWV